MNYRHAFHAGNFADVVKHAILARIVSHLRKKEAPFRVIDTHAGLGVYDLHGPQAQRNPEWRAGIGIVAHAHFDPEAEELIAGYLAAVKAFNPGGELRIYPGSPALVRHWLRRMDRMIACELEPQTARALAGEFRGDNRVKTIAIDGWTALSAFIPPKERRGLVLIDPPYEQPDEFERLAAALQAAHAKWPTGILYAWYPVKDADDTRMLERGLRGMKPGRLLRMELLAAAEKEGGRLRGSGQIVVNPPWTLEAELRVLLPALAKILAPAVTNPVRIDWLNT